MAAQALQKLPRLPTALTLATLSLLSCATALRSEHDLVQAPVELQQKIEEAEHMGSDSLLPPTAPAPQQHAPASAPVSLPGTLVAPAHAAPAAKKRKGKILKSALASPAPLVTTPLVSTWLPKAWPYGIGEKISMVLRYGPLEGGVARLEVAEPQIVDGEPTIHYVGTVKSSKILEFFYKVDDRIDTWVGLKDHLPRRQEIRQLESSRWGRRVVAFDQQKQMAKFFAHATKKDGSVEDIRRDDAMTPFAQDVFGALYFYRFVDNLSLLNFPIHDRFRNWANQLTYLGEESIHVPAGQFETRHYKMFPRVSGNLEPKGDVEIWISNDEKKVMVQFKAKIKVGSITGMLTEYEPGHVPNFAVPVMRTPTSLSP